MELARGDPDIGRKTAQAWRADGGGIAARHCTAVALLGLGHYAEAAQMLRTLADGAAAQGSEFKIELLSQSANAWLIAGKPMTAYEVQTEALEARPNDVELLIDRSISLASTRSTSCDVSLRSTSTARLSRVYSSTIVSNFSALPLCVRSNTKS